jgi:tetratricopeptide (TPR) repeat protein
MQDNRANRTFLHILLVSIVGLLIYSNTFHAQFVFDDEPNIVQNPAIKTFRYFLEPSAVMALDEISANFRYAFITRIVGYFTFALNYHFHGLDVTGYHIVNLLVHLLNAILVYFLIRLIFHTPFFLASRARHPASPFLTPEFVALFSALIFISHPLQTQAVTYITQRFASLATLFFLGSLTAYGGSRLATTDAARRTLYGSALLLAFLSMLVKEISFTLPVAIVLFEFFFFTGVFRRRVLLLFPFILAMLVIPATLLLAHGSFLITDIADSMKVLAANPAVSRWDYLLTQFTVVVLYLRLLFLPINQNVDYDHPVHSSSPFVFVCFLILLFIASIGIYSLHRSRNRNLPERRNLRLIAFGIAWFFLTMSVESSIIPIDDLVFEHRLYLPFFGFVTVFMAAISILEHAIAKSRNKRFLGAALLLLVSLLATSTYFRNAHWRTSISLWEDAVSKSPFKDRPHYNLGVAYTTQGRTKDSSREYAAAVRINPRHLKAHNNLGLDLAKQGRTKDAIAEYLVALQIDPEYPEAHYNLGIAYAAQGRTQDAIDHYSIATRINPSYWEAHINLGVVYFTTGRTAEAINSYLAALQINPEFAVLHYNLGLAYAAEGRIQDAIQEYRIATRMSPTFLEAHYDLGVAYEALGRLAEASSEFSTVMGLNPNHVGARQRLQNIVQRSQ